MKPIHCGLGILAAAVVGGALSAGLFSGPRAEAQSAAPMGAIGRYQVSAYAGPTDGALQHGCYMVDTPTGEVWHLLAGG